ncbi:MAG: hypothetical protein ISP91_04685 [Pseudomonadales bacterium]|nr:hypothetical protein [Pseudomonadales bacterium]
MIDPAALYTLLGSFALLFAMSALEKYQDVVAFRQQVADYRVLPEFLVPVEAITVVAAEVIAATLLITQAYLWGVMLGLAMLLLYAAGILANLLRGRTHIDCGCLGSRGEGISYFHVLRNILLAAFLSACTLAVGTRDLVWLDYLTIIIAVAAASGIYVTMTLLISNYTEQRLWWSE